MADLQISFKGPGRGRNRLGQYNSEPYREVLDSLRSQAIAFQTLVVEELQSTPYRRPSVRTGRLERATADPRNVYVSPDASMWGVGVPSFLDQSIAKYWRTIDEGSAATWGRGGMSGMKIYGRWGGSIKGLHYSQRWGVVAVAGAPWGAANGKLRGIPHAVAQAKGLEGVEIKREIEPKEYYHRAAQRFEAGEVAMITLRDVFGARIAGKPFSSALAADYRLVRTRRASGRYASR